MSSCNTRVDFSLIKEASRLELIKLLDGVKGKKAIVWDEQLAGTFSLVADYSFLQSHDVIKMFYISNNQLPSSSVNHLIFITRTELKLMDLINLQIRKEGLNGGISKEYHVWFVPRMVMMCEKRLQEHGVYASLTSVRELPLLLFRLESDLVTMELPMCYRDMYLNNDPTSLFLCARSLMLIQSLFGIIPNVFGKGGAAKQVFDLMVKMRCELDGQDPPIAPRIDQLILIDRSVDLITPLVTQLTYEGLIDQLFTINNCVVKLPGEKFASCSSSEGVEMNNFETTKTISLSSSLHNDIRDVNFSAVGGRLAKHAKAVASQFDERHKAQTVGEMKQFVQKLPQMQASKQTLACHTTIAELIHEKIMNGTFRCCLQMEQEFLKGIDTDQIHPLIEDLIARKEPFETVLRLICLQSVVNGGLKNKVFQLYKKEIIHTYGFQYFLTLCNLEKVGLFKLQTKRNNYSMVRKTLQLTVDDVNEQDPCDVSYVHSGYAPLSVRLVEFLQSPGWRAITGVLQVLPGPTLMETQQMPSGIRQRRYSSSSVESCNENGICLVFFIGGCTYSEVAALRFLSCKDQGGPEYIIATTKMINTKSFIHTLSQNLKQEK